MGNSNNDKRKALRDTGKIGKQSLATIEKVSSSLSDQLTDEKNTNFSNVTLFYVTYGCGTNLNKKYSVVQAEDSQGARELVQAQIKLAYAFIYSAEHFAGQAEKYGLEEVPIQPQKHI